MRTIAILLTLSLFLTGCGLGSVVRAGYNLIATPAIAECYQMKGKTLSQVEEVFGKPDRVKEITVQDPPGHRYQLTYTKGAMSLIVEVANIKPEERVITVDCSKK